MTGRAPSGRGGADQEPFDAPGGCSSMVELQPSKLAMWVRFPSPAPGKSVFISRPQAPMPDFPVAHVAQSVEHFLGKEEVSGSIPLMGSSPQGRGRGVIGWQAVTMEPRVVIIKQRSQGIDA